MSKREIRLLGPLLLICVLLPLSRASAQWQPDSADRGEVAAARSLATLRSNSRLQPFFAASAGFAVFPSVVRVGLGSGLVHGQGIVVEGDRTVGRAVMWEFVHGIWGGIEVQRMIIFFRDAEAVARYKRSQWQFQGRAGAAVAAVGASIDPAFDRGVAIFTQTRGGLLLEAAVGAAHHRFRPLDD